MINSELRNRKICLLQNNLTYLKTIQKSSKASFLNNFEKKYATRHVIQECIQVCIDIAFHLCLINNLGDPDHYRDAFSKLSQYNILSEDIANRLSLWTGLRNILAHLYEKVDDERIFMIIQSNLNDFDEFIQELSHLEISSK